MVDLVPDAPINYSQMRSDVKRFQPMGREAGMLDVVYNIDTAHKQGLSTAVQPGGKCEQAAMTYSCFKSDAQRFGKGSFLDVGVPNGSEYNTDTAHKKTMVHESEKSPFILSNMSSKTARFSADDVGKDAAWNASYNIDTGHKKTMSTAIENTPVVYSNVRTSTKRFPGHMPRNSVEETQYDTDTGDKTCMTSAVARNQIPDPTTAILKSRTRRFQPPRGSEGIDGGGYHTDTKLTALSTQTVLDSTPLQYANVRTKTDRFGKDFRDKQLDVVYDTDTGHKKCMTTAVASSPINYANMNSVVPRFKAPKRENKHNNDGGCVTHSLQTNTRARTHTHSPHARAYSFPARVHGACTKQAALCSVHFPLCRYYRPNARLLERLYEHFRKSGKLKQLQAEYVPPEADS